MHSSAELYIPVSDVPPSLAMQITLFSLLRGIKNLEKPKKQMTEPMSQYPKPRKPKKNKRPNLCPSIWHGVSTFVFLFFWFFEVKLKKQKGRTYVPVSGMGSILLFFCFLFLEVKLSKNQKTKRQNLCPSIWHGVSTLFFWFVEVFAIFWYLTWVLPFCFVCAFLFFSKFLQFSGI